MSDGKPPLDLSVNVTTTAGGQYRWDGQSRDPRNVPQGLSFRTKRGDGFADASVTLARRVDTDYVDLGLYDDVSIVGADGSVAYEGRVGAMPRSMDSTHSVTVQMAGWMAHARDRKFREIYVDRDLSHFEGVSTTRQAALIGASPTYRITDFAVTGDNDAAIPSIAMTHNLDGGARTISEAWYDAGPGCLIASMYFEFVETATQGTDSSWFTEAFSSATDGSVTERGTDRHDTASTSPTSYSGTFTPSTPRRWAGLHFGYESTTAASPGADRLCSWRKVAVFGDHGLTKQGASDAQGFYASDVIKNIASRWCPKLNTAGVQDTTYPIAQLAFLEPTDPYDAFLDVNKYHLWNLAVWENKTLYYTPTDLTDYDWEIRLSDPGVTVDLQGDSTDQLANGICVTYTDAPSGKQKRITPDDYDELADTSDSNPANKAGLTVWPEITLTAPSTEDDALQVGRMVLAEYNQPKGAGTIKVRGHIRDRAGHWHPVWKVRSGDRVIVSDHPNDRVRQVVETDYNHDSYTVTLAIDQTFKRVDAYLDRLGTALSIGTLAP